MSEIIDRNVLVCIQNNCRLCNVMVKHVPKKCKFPILHCLETLKLGNGTVEERPRQSGKTTKLMDIARQLMMTDMPVYYVTLTYSMVEHVKHTKVYGKHVQLFSYYRVKEGHLNCKPGYILTDELTPSQAEVVERSLSGSRLLAGYYTNMG